MLVTEPNRLDLMTIGMGPVPTALIGKIFMTHIIIIYVQM